ncbi:ribonuclease HII [Candidatus Parcubacteria bacterium]|uniref:Ribonuclease n=1 Tax=Candidatus Uhrbacteria bacterium CG_4_9_14_3_um_filter_41_35 TaxID=1975034 RepID=A0A2M7XD24_9BACT|nr:ribonuclease HII [Candidatus Parcubacteria bacterium]PIQ67203.1 MAG: ribonuclease HII [Candidatus Uhrbacteria bacterium CG11_big_fil_rev_8_21_14_0_20_41_9]PIZ53381.1 MAG: ribonuclease HII [Candidatus Uhrbacteria bacterium CG_4_10_14_0_2_um_filter_41_7]PJA45790.1 MAG: ribonuclease HII [Candidatus Uhrbacteria bacterium CG_4_9_14_3_um_filter_41_35]
MFKNPNLEHERELNNLGYRAVVGVDKAGCSALAGPVVAAACVLPVNCKIGRIHDSKFLTPFLREFLYLRLISRARSWGVGIVSVKEIMQMGIKSATLLAMKRALTEINEADYCLVNTWTIPELEIHQCGVMEGAHKTKSIAAASLIAKVTRNRLMKNYDKKYPQYGFAKHKGYPTRAHQDAIKEFGPCAIHRLTFKAFEEYARR